MEEWGEWGVDRGDCGGMEGEKSWEGGKGGFLGQTMLNAGFLGLVDDELLQFLLVGRRELGEVELAYGSRGGVHVDGTWIRAHPSIFCEKQDGTKIGIG